MVFPPPFPLLDQCHLEVLNGYIALQPLRPNWDGQKEAHLHGGKIVSMSKHALADANRIAKLAARVLFLLFVLAPMADTPLSQAFFT